ncbi:hypothetical protein [Falsiroseomonas oryziterrae]|uniref:hypothetical protein n=1 Tax=Falsiroseomonas oryziterrae TaxID=2911368 RepID=UPI001F2ECA2D|nr:hypothetical protein [Roseomonas sp. NPKOSM-4]
MRLRAAPDAPPQDFIVTVPAARSAVYAGTFRRDCAGDAPSSCRLVPTSGDEAAARDAVPQAQRAAFPFVAAPAQPYPPRLAGTNLPPPTSPTIMLDTAQWLAAVDWERIAAETGADAGRPEGSYTFAAALGAPFMAATALGAAAPALVVVGAVAVMVPIGVLSMIVRAERERRTAGDAAAAEARIAEINARAAEARAALSPCEAMLAAALSPESVAPHLQAAMPAPRGSQRARNAEPPWQVTVNRVLLRRCDAEAAHFGVEVATRWTAQGYDASFVRPVQGATPDSRLRWSTPAPWEVPVSPAGACRPLAEWCAAGGRALLDDVTQSVLGARDAIAATR